jgi:pectin methylesterase-like acyl-CoA thioesterase
MRKVLFLAWAVCCILPLHAANPYDNPDTLFVAGDGSEAFRTIGEAVEVCRAFMDYHKVIFVKKGVYKEKLIIPQWLQNIEICGEDRDQTIITWDDHANIRKMGTFRTFTVRVDANDITFRNITIENNAPRLGQAVALHTQGDRLQFVNCRFLGNQDTVYTGMPRTRLYFIDCYIEGTTDFIFGPSTAWFERCSIFCKADSYITAASTPRDVPYGYIFNHCTVSCAQDVKQVYLGRPWRDYGYTLFMNSELPRQIRAEGWHPWRPEAVKTARYLEYNNHGEGADRSHRVAWSRQLSQQEAQDITISRVFDLHQEWRPAAIIPEPILQYVKTSFPGTMITKIDKERYGYDVELSNDIDLKFNYQGMIIGMDD